MATRTTRARCPMCKVELDPAGPNPNRPFCSPRCRLLDLSRWLGGEYAIAGAPDNGGARGDEADADEEGAW